MIFKISIVLMVLVLAFAIYQTAWHGIQSRKLGVLIKGHTGWATFTLCWMLATIIVIELSVRFMEHAPRGALFSVHLPFAGALAVVIVLMRFIFTGKKFQKTHRWLSYACYVCAAVAIPTGIALAFR